MPSTEAASKDGSMEKKRKLPSGALAARLDWFGPISHAKLGVFRSSVEELDSLYWMLSVSMDEATALRKVGEYERAFQVISITPTLCARFARQLKRLLRMLQEHVSNHDLTPGVTPLPTSSLQSNRVQFSSLKGSLLIKMHFPQQFRFLAKCRALQALAERLSHDFCHSASALKETGSSNAAERICTAMCAAQYDLNSCVRETVEMLKCVLRVTPAEQLQTSNNNAVSAQSADLSRESKVSPVRAKRLEPVAAFCKITGQILRPPQ